MLVALINAHTSYAPGASATIKGSKFVVPSSQSVVAEYYWSVELNKELKTELEQYGIRSVIIDGSSVKPYSASLSYKAIKVEEAGAEVALETHLNSAPSGTGGAGFEVLYSTLTSKSRELAVCVAEAFNTFLPFKPRRGNGLFQVDNIFILNHIKCASIIIEPFFISNPIEASYLLYDRAARSIAAITAVGLTSYIRQQTAGVSNNNGSIREKQP
jgi:N-acetylmuramoyl-L-alanine amidase